MTMSARHDRGCLRLLLTCSITIFSSTASAQPSPLIVPISSLRTWLAGSEERVSIRGVVTRTGRDSFVQDATGGVLVHFVTPIRTKVGDEIEITGLPRATPYSDRLEQATGRVLWAGVPPPPMAITLGQAARGDFENEFVELEARLDHIEARPDNVSVLLMAGKQQSFMAILQTANGRFILPRLTPHSMVRLKGVCSMDLSLTRDAFPFVLLLRSAEDVEELAGPPWWTPQLLLRDFLILLSLFLFATLIYLRLRAARSRAIQQEREHIAHEMHDTLAQSFAGVAFQLQAIRSGLPSEAGQLTGHVELAINMVRHSHHEARSSIAALRTRSRNYLPLANELLRSLERMIADGPLRVDLSLTGIPRSLPLRTSNALLRIGQEAGANAINHSGASVLKVRLIYLERAIMLEVEDDGCGFDADGAVTHGFGLSGMRTRASKLHGTLNVISQPGEGTTISASVPLHARRLWRFIERG